MIRVPKAQSCFLINSTGDAPKPAELATLLEKVSALKYGSIASVLIVTTFCSVPYALVKTYQFQERRIGWPAKVTTI